MASPSVHVTIDQLWNVGLEKQKKKLGAMYTSKPYNPVIAGAFSRLGQIEA
jgi:hypothetical protein